MTTMTGLPPAYRLLGPVLSFEVRGVPVPQAAIRPLGKGRPAVHENAATLKPWRNRVAAVAHNEIAAARRLGYTFPLAGPLGMHLHFSVPKPKSAPKTRRTFPDVRPDLSHLVRAVEDALSLPACAPGVRAIGNDGQIVYELTTKAYPGEEQQALDEPGVLIRVYQIGVTDE